MHPAALGLTCKEALEVFSANETLRLQARVHDLEAEVKKLQEDLQRTRNQKFIVAQAGVCPYGLDIFAP